MFRKNMLSHVHSLLGGDYEIGDFIVTVASQVPTKNRGMVFSAPFAKQQLTATEERCFL
jgi:hypothetical protein